jgi:hypothetical protein
MRQFYLRRLAVGGHSISLPAFRALRELPLEPCYESALATHPDLAGQITLTLALDADGKPHDVTATGVDDGVAHCIADAVARASFPAGDAVKASVAVVVAPHEQ